MEWWGSWGSSSVNEVLCLASVNLSLNPRTHVQMGVVVCVPVIPAFLQEHGRWRQEGALEACRQASLAQAVEWKKTRDPIAEDKP